MEPKSTSQPFPLKESSSSSWFCFREGQASEWPCRSTPRRSLEIRATLKILVEAKVLLPRPNTLNLEELIRKVFGRPNSSTSTPEQLAPTEPIMSNGNTPTPQEMTKLFNALKEELQ
ncbi:hypothetical protein PIB30_019153 [Stylosanthes scabra]|uniref:Uncharacterized protein n=1 Tax=Stylosanthes scabra TaxID=79078 RepID=A0ABU6X8C6_9FABA|nr:hypothetical protein [Stylosanthes scabra]